MDAFLSFLQLPAGVLIPLILLLACTSSLIKIGLIFSVLFLGLGLHGTGARFVALALTFVCAFFVSGPEIERALSSSYSVKSQPGSGQGADQSQNSVTAETATFLSTWKDTLNKKIPPEDKSAVAEIAGAGNDESWRVIAPTFVLQQVRQGLSAAFKILLPFLVIDLLVAYAFTALGVQTLATYTLSVPLKILAFIGVGGFDLIAKNLLQTVS